MSHRYVTVTVETRAGEDENRGRSREITDDQYNLDLEAGRISFQIESARFHEDLHDHLLNLLRAVAGREATTP